MKSTMFEPTSPVPCLIAGRPVFDQTIWLRLPRPGDRCPISGLSRSTLSELVRPCARNNFAPPVAARLLKRRDARRGVLLVSRESLLGYLSDLPAPAATIQRKEAVR